MREDTNSIFEHIREQIGSALEISEARTIAVGLGGSESWAVLLAATDLIGRENVLAVTVHSTQTDSNIPWSMSRLCRSMMAEHCAIDVSRILTETLDAKIDVGQVQIEPLHRTMDSLMKAEVMADIRDGMVRAIASRHDSLYLGAISRSKIVRGWGIPAAQSFDWNPLSLYTHHQLKRAIVGRGIGREAADMDSALDLLPDGGPFPPDLSGELVGPRCDVPRFGVGLFQGGPEDDEGESARVPERIGVDDEVTSSDMDNNEHTIFESSRSDQ